jgi:hypothetical protein
LVNGLTPGRLTVRVSRAGYTPAHRELTLSENHVLDVMLQPERNIPDTLAAAGTAVDALSERSLAGVTVRVAGVGETTTGADGGFRLTGQVAGSRQVTLASAMTVDRHTHVSLPADALRLTLIPRSLDLRAFDEMFRARGGLRRWAHAPRLVIERRVLQFTNTSETTYTATGGMLTDAEVNDLLRDLTWALPQLTGQHFGGFGGVDIELAGEGASVSVVRPGAIIVARYAGLTPSLSYWGYGRWAWNARGEVVSGILMLDDAFERSGSGYRRALRAHELGHTLGYDHVSVCLSVMNESGRVEPTNFDREGTRIAFLRPPLNASPDIDPDPVAVSKLTGSLIRWAGRR